MAGTARFEWIADVMAVRPDDLVLEIGAGSSPSVTHLAARLSTGRIVAVDRSATAVRRAAERHAALVDSGRLRLLHAALADLPTTSALDDSTFDKVLAVNVNLFWTTRCTTELAFLHSRLTPGGALFLCYGYGDPAAPSTSPKPPPQRLADSLSAAGFDVEARTSGDLLAVVATPRKAH